MDGTPRLCTPRRNAHHLRSGDVLGQLGLVPGYHSSVISLLPPASSWALEKTHHQRALAAAPGTAGTLIRALHRCVQCQQSHRRFSSAWRKKGTDPRSLRWAQGKPKPESGAPAFQASQKLSQTSCWKEIAPFPVPLLTWYPLMTDVISTNFQNDAESRVIVLTGRKEREASYIIIFDTE